MRRNQILTAVSVVTGIATRVLKRWWWSLDHRQRGRALGWLERVANGSLRLRVAWDEWVTHHGSERKTLEPREAALGGELGEGHRRPRAPRSPRLRIVGPAEYA